ncbi:hypothetical protein [Kaistella jeonii]|uniref:Uncharacterized protein n=1 Tax=Kaistella jeonii TaxID=266749 RepID=A0A0C1FDB5_9FLAO|nr:hypothetical protein [Kaistella jeonii]KIA85969.1 hypothetical protein OA86_14205 [Kaistella jeonii]SFC38473.1 hypothetical protein SAMN05421876_11736 [Kaistella jeonii]VEI96847.1 Uncharacterised protein [Kaistella jeonii]
MVKSRLKSVFFLVFFFFSFQSVFGQIKITNDQILKEVQQIKKVFSDSLKRYDFKKDEHLYSEKYRTFYSVKIESLSKLYQDLYDRSVADVSTLEKSGTSENQTSDLQLGIEDIENGEQLKELGLFLRTNYPAYLFSDYSSATYRCKLNFLVDTDGKFKKVKYSGESLAFNLMTALFLYSIDHLEKPLRHNDQLIKQNFAQPVTLVIE